MSETARDILAAFALGTFIAAVGLWSVIGAALHAGVPQ